MPLYLHPLLKKADDSLAQLAEHLPFKERVLGSSPRGITKQPRTFGAVFSFRFFIYL